MDPKKVELIFSSFRKSNPIPKIELSYINHFTLLIAIILSARTTDVSVNKVTEQLFKIADSPQKILDLGEEELKNYICHIGLYNTKAKNIVKLSTILIEKYNANVPTEFGQLVALPGVGRKSANVFLNSALGMPTLAADTHVFRVSNRTGLVKEKSVIETEKSLLAIVPKNGSYMLTTGLCCMADTYVKLACHFAKHV